jgi:hypothetical protein
MISEIDREDAAMESGFTDSVVSGVVPDAVLHDVLAPVITCIRSCEGELKRPAASY